MQVLMYVNNPISFLIFFYFTGTSNFINIFQDEGIVFMLQQYRKTKVIRNQQVGKT